MVQSLEADKKAMKALIEQAEKFKLKMQVQEQQIRADTFEKENARPPPPSPAPPLQDVGASGGRSASLKNFLSLHSR